jgi:hypothetical protein
VIVFGVTVIMEKVEQRARQQEQIRREPEGVRPMLAQDEKRSDDGE